MNTTRPVHQAARRRYTSSSSIGHWTLTRAEWGVVEAICAGHESNTQLGQALVISERTAQSHVYNIFNKLGIRSKALLVLKVLGDEVARKRCFPHLRIFGGNHEDVR